MTDRVYTRGFTDLPTAASALLEEYRDSRTVYFTDKIRFSGVGDMDVYNISRPFRLHGRRYIAGRVERRDSEISSVRFFEHERDNLYRAVEGIDIPCLQDPCVTEYGDGIVVGGTKVFLDGAGRIATWRTTFYRGETLGTLKEFACAPDGMKDVRFIRRGGRTSVFTRPQGGAAGPGKIGYIEVETPEHIRPETLRRARLMNCFKDTEWGGANELFNLSNGLIGVLGHISCRTTEDGRPKLHYYSMAFAFRPETHERTRLKIIAERRDFADGPAKRPDLTDVLFTGGLIRRPDGKAELYTGTSDTEGQYIVINDPFIEYEAMRLPGTQPERQKEVI